MLRIVVVAVILVSSSSVSAGIIHVKHNASGANNGSSWGDAFTELQPGIDAASSGDEVWVATGTYKPTSWPNGGTKEREKHFSLKNGVAVYGGFDGTETTLDQRDLSDNQTILSGDFNGDDVVTISGSILTIEGHFENSYHVFYHPNVGLNGTALLNGFQIKSGNANGYSPHHAGGGIYNYSSSPTLANCTITGNSARNDGGGIYNDSSSPTLANCTITGNSARNDGGGIYNDSSSPTLMNCTITGNSAKVDGGGVYNYYSSPNLTNCILWQNSSSNTQDMIYNYGSYPTVSNCVVEGGYAGGSSIIEANPLLQPLHDNGGGLMTMAIPPESPAVDKGTAIGTPMKDARGITRSNPPDIGAYENDGPLSTWLEVEQAAIDFGNTVVGYEKNTRAMGVHGSALTDDVTIHAPLGFDLSLNNTSWSSTLGLTKANGMVDQIIYIRFRPTAAISYSGTLTYSSGSVNGSIDVSGAGHGAYVIYVSLDGDNSSGRDWSSAYKDLQFGIEQAAQTAIKGAEVWVKAGKYLPTTWPNRQGSTFARAKHFSLRNNVSVYGGFAGFETILQQRDIVENPTILSGDINGDDVVIGSGESLKISGNSENINNVFFHPASAELNSSAFLDGVTISGGYAITGYHGGGMYHDTTKGGGMYNDSSSPTLVNCTISGNSGYDGGGGIYNHLSSPSLLECQTSANYVDQGKGGGIYNDFSSPTLLNCATTGNSANNDGGGIYNYCSSPTLMDCIISENASKPFGNGGGMCNYESSPSLMNCSLSNNSAGYNGGGLSNIYYSSPSLINCTISNNSSSDYGGGIYNYESFPTVTNCTIVSNSANQGGALHNSWESSVTLMNCTIFDNNGQSAIYNSSSYVSLTNCILWQNSTFGPEVFGISDAKNCIIEGGYSWGINIIDLDPVLGPLQDNGGAAYTMAIDLSSPAFDAGTPTDAPLTDARGYKRDAIPDIGAYEVGGLEAFSVIYNASENGTIIGESIQTVFYGEDGSEVTAVPDTGYHFTSWSDGNTDNPRTELSVTSNISVMANFAIDTFTVTAKSNGPGTVSPSTQTVNYGSNSVKISATPISGYKFVQWNDGNTDNPRVIADIRSDVSITAAFAKKDYGNWHDENFRVDSDGCSMGSEGSSNSIWLCLFVGLIALIARFRIKSQSHME